MGNDGEAIETRYQRLIERVAALEVQMRSLELVHAAYVKASNDDVVALRHDFDQALHSARAQMVRLLDQRTPHSFSGGGATATPQRSGRR